MLAAAAFAAVGELCHSFSFPCSPQLLLPHVRLAQRFAEALRLAARKSETLAAASAALMAGDFSASAMCVPGTALPFLAQVVEI